MNWSGRRVLVTGAGGFIGSHLCERLLHMGAVVRAVVHGNMQGNIGYLSQVPEPLSKNLEIYGGNIRDGAFVRDAAVSVDTVFHLAAITSVVYSYSNPDETIVTNVQGTLNVCNAARHEKVRRLIHISSAGVYGTAENGEPISETHPVRAYNPYTASKLAADNVTESFHLSYDLPVATCRIFNVYGPRINRFLVIPTIILQLLKGSELKMGDLSPTRNFTYVDDMLTGFIRTAEEDAMVGQIVNFGSARAVTIRELVNLIAELMGCDVTPVADPDRFRPVRSEIPRVVADSTKAKKLLQWQPTISLEEGLVRTIDWIKAGGYGDMARTA